MYDVNVAGSKVTKKYQIISSLVTRVVAHPLRHKTFVS